MHLNRYKAFAIHACISMAVVGIFLFLTFYIWYPSPLFTVEGAKFPLQILVTIDVILGPLLTLIVFNPKKKELKFDLAVIASIQLAAFIYGANVIYSERPAFVAFAVDFFTVIPQGEADTLEMDKLDTTLVKRNDFGPTYVYAELPTDPEANTQLMFEVITEGKHDIQKRPEFYRDYSSHIKNNYSRAIDLTAFGEKHPDAKPLINDFFTTQGLQASDVAAFPLKGKHRDLILVINKSTTAVAGYIDTNPWPPVTTE